MRDLDDIIVRLLAAGRLRADCERGLVYAPRSNTPEKPIGTVTKKGYRRACLHIDGDQVHVMVHRVIWVATHGPLPPGYQIDHGLLGKIDNRLSNLDAVTGRENMRRGADAGLFRNVGRKDGIRDSKGRFREKTRAGRLLDGVEHNSSPEGRHA